MTLVIDASVAVAALVDNGSDGLWAEGFLSTDLVAPQLIYAEVANVLRRAVQAGTLSNDFACIAYGDLLALRIQSVSYELVAKRVWELRHNLTAYDAWYVAVAELLGLPLATLDRRLMAAPGPTCDFLTLSE